MTNTQDISKTLPLQRGGDGGGQFPSTMGDGGGLDLIIIGSGPGGYRAAAYAAQKGLQVTIIEKDHLGGTCLNSGCIPTKTLCHHAEQIMAARQANASADGLTPGQPLQWEKILAHKNEVITQLRAGVKQLMSTPGITLIKGEAEYLGNKTVRVKPSEISEISENSESPERPVLDGSVVELTAKNIIIATGSSPKLPPIEGINLPHVLTSTELLDLDKHADRIPNVGAGLVPARLCVIGAGVIGLEMASVFNAFGSKVTVIEFLKECLPAMDSDLAKRLRKSMEKSGIEFFMQSGVKKITPTEVIFADKKGREQSVPADCVLIATGRKPNILKLSETSETSENSESSEISEISENSKNSKNSAIPVDDNFQTSEPGVYAIGDVNGRCLLAHAATFQGFRAVNHILSTQSSPSSQSTPSTPIDNIRFDIMPAAVFTVPEIAAVGPTEQQLKERMIESEAQGDESKFQSPKSKVQSPGFKVLKGYYRNNGRALANDCTDGLLKLIVDDNDRILACHVLGSHAADIVQEATVLINLNATLSQLRDIIHTHPTLAEILHEVSL